MANLTGQFALIIASAVLSSTPSSELDGLKASLLAQEAGTHEVVFSYSLERLRPGAPWIIDPTMMIQIRFFDRNKKWIDSDVYQRLILDGFAEGKIPQIAFRLTAKRPPNAEHVVICLGNSGLDTPLVRIQRVVALAKPLGCMPWWQEMQAWLSSLGRVIGTCDTNTIAGSP